MKYALPLGSAFTFLARQRPFDRAHECILTLDYMLASISRPAFAAARSPLRRTNQLSRSFSSTRSRFSDKTGANNASSSSVQPAATSEPLKKYNDQTTGTQNPRSQTVNGVKERLRVWATRNATALRQKMDTFSASAQIAFSHLGGRLNEVTGYREIEQLKNLVVENGASTLVSNISSRQCYKI